MKSAAAQERASMPLTLPLPADPGRSYVGGLRRLAAAERAEWRRHGAPHPPTPGRLAELEAAAAEEEWSSDEEEDLDIGAAAALQPSQLCWVVPGLPVQPLQLVCSADQAAAWVWEGAALACALGVGGQCL